MMKKFLCVILCICLLFSTEMITLVASAVDAVADIDLSPIANAIDALLDDHATITVNFYYQATDKEVQNAYVARITPGNDFQDNLVPPSTLGYRATGYTLVSGPDSGHQWVDGTLKLNFVALDSDVVINVYYEPIEVNYSVRYFFQNINDDGYTEETALYKTEQAITGQEFNNEELGLTQAEATTVGIDLNAFTLLYFIPDKVAADGSTVFECYYDRNYYTINFELDGGYGVEPLHERYGTKIIIPTPKKPGFVFNGWDDVTTTAGDGVADTPISTMGTTNKTYKAMWKVNQDLSVNYTIVYWLDNGLGESRVLWNEAAVAKVNQLVSGSNNLAQVYDEYQDYMVYDKADVNVAVKGDGSTLVNVYYTCQMYALRFFYARSSGTGSNIKYEIVGGSTWYFGHTSQGNKTTIEGCLENIPDDQWGEVKSKPAILNTYLAKSEVTEGSVSYQKDKTTYTYYYFDLTIPYGCDLTNLWPVGIFEPIAVDSKHQEDGHATNNGNCLYPNAYFSAWNGEYRVNYTHTHSGNPTIKGFYKVFDDELIYKSNYTEELNSQGVPIVNFMSYWVNGADVSWSIPKQFEYFICTEMLEAPKTSELTLVVSNYDKTEYKDDEDNRYIRYGGVWYFADKDLRFYVYDDSGTSGQTDISVEGFTFTGSKIGEQLSTTSQYFKESWNVYFYYSRNSTLKLMFHDGQKPLNDKTVTGLHYDSDISNKYFVPEYYDADEKNAYYFDGWYTDTSCLDQYKFDFETQKMPAENLVLYAKWVLVKHNVYFFDTFEHMKDYQNDPESIVPLQTFQNVTHYDVMGSIYKDTQGNSLQKPTKSMTLADGRVIELDFVGWFYMDGDMRRAYDRNNTAVTDDLYVFAIWRSNVPQPYEVRFVTINDQGQKIEIADSIQDYARLGATITFTAKAGYPYNQLYVIGDTNYNKNYFPETQSHSITIVEGQNYYEFVYRNASTPIEYVIRVVDENGKEWYRETKSTFDSVVEERYIPTDDIAEMEGYYIPDAFYKKLVISVVWDAVQNKYVGTDANVITFVYTQVPDKVGSYIVRYKMQELDGTYPEDTYHHTYIEDYVTILAQNQSVDIAITAPTFSGYTQATAKNAGQTVIKYDVLDVNGNVIESDQTKNQNKKYYRNNKLTVTEEGVTLVLYYARRTDLSYTVKYLKYGTNETIAGVTDKTVQGQMYGKTVTELPKTINGYNCVTGTASKSLEITANGEQNVITFLYEPIQYQVQYFAVTFHGNSVQSNPEKGGSLSRSQENKAFGVGTFQTVVATPKQYYEFAGWYTDPECTISANSYGTVNGVNFQPDDTKLNPTGVNKFYAKFERKTGSLTITRDFTGVDAGQVFVYKITNNADSNELYVTASASHPTIRIEGLLQGEYRVEQVSDWSWRYTADTVKNITISNDEMAVTFSNSPTNALWLNYNSPFYRNIFDGAVN